MTDKLLEILTKDSPTLPGLDFDTISENYIDKTYPHISKLLPTEREKFVNKQKEYIKDLFNEKITIIKTNFKNAQENLSDIKTMLTTFAVTATPPVIGTVAPNPAWILADNMQKVKMIQSILGKISEALVVLLLAAKFIKYDVPAPVETVVMSVGIIGTILKNIPLPNIPPNIPMPNIPNPNLPSGTPTPNIPNPNLPSGTPTPNIPNPNLPLP